MFFAVINIGDFQDHMHANICNLSGIYLADREFHFIKLDKQFSASYLFVTRVTVIRNKHVLYVLSSETNTCYFYKQTRVTFTNNHVLHLLSSESNTCYMYCHQKHHVLHVMSSETTDVRKPSCLFIPQSFRYFRLDQILAFNKAWWVIGHDVSFRKLSTSVPNSLSTINRIIDIMFIPDYCKLPTKCKQEHPEKRNNGKINFLFYSIYLCYVDQQVNNFWGQMYSES